MNPGQWYEGVSTWHDRLFWLIVFLGISVYTWWTHGNWKVNLAIIAFLALFIEFDMSTRQIAKLMDRIKQLEDQMYIMKELQSRVYILEARTK